MSIIDDYLQKNKQYAGKATVHAATYPGTQPIKPAKRVSYPGPIAPAG
jgi:hypothetical protein